MRSQRPGHAPGGIRVARPEQGQERATATGDVQRQEAVVAVVAVKDPALLAAVHLIVRRVDVQHEPGRRLALPGVDERLQEHALQRVRVVLDPVVAARLAARGRVLETVQRALARQCRTALAASLQLAGQQRQQGVVPQLVVIVEILVPQGNAHDPLGHQCPHRVLRQTAVAVVREACGHPVHETERPVDLPEQQSSRVRRDPSTIERGRYPPAPTPLKCEGNGLTLCRHRSSGVVTVKFMGHMNLTAPGGRCLLVGVRNPG